jgi:hypothetical protein
MTIEPNVAEIAVQKAIDAFYWQYGPCCAGCDWWRADNSHVGTCTKAAPVPADQRIAMLGMSGASINIGAGHPFTPRDYHCGAFKDEFDWLNLTPWYLREIGYRDHLLRSGE